MHGVADRDADQRAGRVVSAGDGGDASTFPACFSVSCTDLPRLDRLHGSDQIPRRVHGAAVGRGHDVARLEAGLGGRSNPPARPAAARPAVSIGTSLPSARSATTCAVCCELVIARSVLRDVLLVGLARRQHLVVGHQLGALDQVLRPQLLDQVGLQLVDVDEVEARSRRPAACRPVRGRRSRPGGRCRAGARSSRTGSSSRRRPPPARGRRPPLPTSDHRTRPQQLHPPATASDPAMVPVAISISPSATERRQPAVRQVAAPVAREHHAGQHAADQPADVTAHRDRPGVGEGEDQVDHQQAADRSAQQLATPRWRSSTSIAPIRPKIAPEAPAVSEFGDSSSAPKLPDNAESR